MRKPKITAKQLDILKELGNICAGNATIALSQILFKKIMLQTTKVQLLPPSAVSDVIDDTGHTIICIQMETLGSIHGSAVLIFSEESAYNLMELLVGKFGQQPKFITQIGISSLKEIGNIVISSYLSTLSSMSRLPVFPSCPQFHDGLPEAVIKSVFGEMCSKNIPMILIETTFSEQVSTVTGHFFITFDSISMETVLKACEKNYKIT